MTQTPLMRRDGSITVISYLQASAMSSSARGSTDVWKVTTCSEAVRGASAGACARSEVVVANIVNKDSVNIARIRIPAGRFLTRRTLADGLIRILRVNRVRRGPLRH